MNDLFSLDGKVVLISGAAGLIGQSVTTACLALPVCPTRYHQWRKHRRGTQDHRGPLARTGLSDSPCCD